MISIIIPAYNAEKDIEKCINSVLHQTYKNLEIIIMNDGSTDNTKQIIEGLEKKDSRIIVIHKENTGVSDTRNVGLEIAKGDYIGFIDSDDEVNPEMYETLLLNMVKHNADISHCGFELVGENLSRVFNGTGETYIQSQKEALVSLLKADIFEPAVWNKLYKKDVVKNIKFDTAIKFNEDLLFNVKAFKNANKIVFEDLPLYKYIYNPLSASRSTPNYKIQESVLKVTELVYEKLQGLNIDNVRNQFYVNKLISVYRAFFDDGTHHSSLGIETKKRLKRSKDKFLDIRTIYLKYSLLYFSSLFKISRLIYDKTFGKNKKWKLPTPIK